MLETRATEKPGDLVNDPPQKRGRNYRADGRNRLSCDFREQGSSLDRKLVEAARMVIR